METRLPRNRPTVKYESNETNLPPRQAGSMGEDIMSGDAQSGGYVRTSRMKSLISSVDHHLRVFLVATMLLLAVGAGIGIDRLVLEFAPVGAQTGNDLV